MDLRRIDLNLLVVFEALVSEGSVSSAARRLHLSQSAMSHALSRLRDAFGDPILVRHGRGMEATPQALAALPEVRSLLVQVGRLFAHGGRFDPATADRSVHIGASDHAAALVLPALIASIRREAPGIRLRLRHAGRVDAPQMLRSGQLDLALGVLNNLTADLATQPLISEPYMCAVAEETATKLPLSRGDYLEAEHINVLVQGDTLGLIDEALARQGLARRIALTVPHFSTALALLPGTPLVYTGPASLFTRTPQGLRLFKPPVDLPEFPTQLAWSVRNQNDEGLQWLRKQIVAQFQSVKKPGANEEERSITDAA
ncbi:LysR family transcriptional regulator [Polaromonas sp. SM01]|uniref:LysR family transcriptional regulator n=1 Tax=Polaromonas sp. SM01 TaxID=3085630 RepID=UPI002980E335|nr:LysR substrate-binding domain-containing protein [Polaromonas sp. SM01]MDW5444514.1 LysR substrate-binding domain-containing protein [Polaromonas sp. SM01]